MFLRTPIHRSPEVSHGFLAQPQVTCSRSPCDLSSPPPSHGSRAANVRVCHCLLYWDTGWWCQHPQTFGRISFQNSQCSSKHSGFWLLLRQVKVWQQGTCILIHLHIHEEASVLQDGTRRGASQRTGPILPFISFDSINHFFYFRDNLYGQLSPLGAELQQ